MPCNPTDLSVNVPSGPSGNPIKGFGIPFAPTLPSFTNPLPGGFPEDLLSLFNSLEFLLPSGPLKHALNPNFGKDIFDEIMGLLDKFFPFLMLYKFFLPVLNLIICIIEVLCAIPNPFKLESALNRLFRECLPEFLSLFPIFALIVMILSLLFLILSLIEYIINEILKIIALLLANINTIAKAIANADAPSILAATRKIGLVLCAFQNLFVILSIFNVIIEAIRDIIKLFFSIPPCDDGDNGNESTCCTPDVCPTFIKNANDMVRNTGTLQYVNKVSQGIESIPDAFSALPTTFFESVIRQESWQFYDTGATIPEAFWNITNAFDLPAGTTQIFFPTDSNYNAGTPTSQVPYLVDLRLFYNPAQFGRTDPLGARFIRVNNCIVLQAPTQKLTQYNNTIETITNGVLQIAGGNVTEDNGDTQVFINGDNATLGNFIHVADTTIIGSTAVLNPAIDFLEVTYTFHIHYEVLLSKALITLGCIPSVALNRTFINSVYGGNAGTNYTFLNNMMNNANGETFPDVAAAQSCLTTALANLRNNISVEGVADFQATTTVCLNQLGADTTSAINSLIGLGFDPYNSVLTLSPQTQFTSQSINVQVLLNETNGQSLTNNLPESVASNLASRIKPIITFGTIGNFVYDGYQAFNAQLTSTISGSGTVEVAFDGNLISTVSVPTDITQTPTITPVSLPYNFIYSPSFNGQDGVPRRDEGDVAREGSTDSDGG